MWNNDFCSQVMVHGTLLYYCLCLKFSEKYVFVILPICSIICSNVFQESSYPHPFLF